MFRYEITLQVKSIEHSDRCDLNSLTICSKTQNPQELNRISMFTQRSPAPIFKRQSYSKHEKHKTEIDTRQADEYYDFRCVSFSGQIAFKCRLPRCYV